MVFATLPGSERYTVMSAGRPVGTGPFPFGRQTSQAIASDRVYVGVADRYEVLVFDLTGKQLPSIVQAGAMPVPLTPADIAAEAVGPGLPATAFIDRTVDSVCQGPNAARNRFAAARSGRV
jgi:hypothetical protein